MMKFNMAMVCVLGGLLALGSLARAEVVGIVRASQVELGSIENGEIVGLVTDAQGDAAWGDGVYKAEVVTATASCRATQTSLAAAEGDSAVVTGSMTIDCDQSAAGVHTFIHAWSSVIAAMDVAAGIELRFTGAMSEGAHVSYGFRNASSGAQIFGDLPSVEGPFTYAVVLPEAGIYELSVFLDQLTNLGAVEARSMRMDFRLVAAPASGVDVQPASWSEVQAQWR